MRYYSRVRHAILRSDALIAATPESWNVFRDYYQKESFLISETGCTIHPMTGNEERYASGKRLELLWVGRFFYAKQLNIALETMAILKDLDVHLHIVGDGNTQETSYYRELATSLSIADKCTWYGKIPHQEVFTLMRKAHLFFFTSVVEETSTVILEAIENALPILCFNTCGFGVVVDHCVGNLNPMNLLQSLDGLAKGKLKVDAVGKA